MASEISLSSAVRDNLLALKDTQTLISRTQNRLSTGLKVSSAIDDPRIYFEAKALSDQASDIQEKKEGVDQAISSVSTALQAIESIDSLVQQMKGLLISAKTATGNELTSIQDQYNELRTQIDNLASDAKYQGLSLVDGTGSTLEVSFSTDTASVLTINSVDMTIGTAGLSLTSAANFSLASNIDAALTEVTSATSTLRGEAKELGSNIAILQTRLDFTNNYVNLLQTGSSKLTLADITEEGANLVALQTRQQIGISALSFAGQSEQAVLQLFR